MIGRNWSLFLGIICLLLVVSVAVPHRPRHTHGGFGNETAAIATLRNISSAQAQFKAMACVDRDGDGTGEYGYFLEMSQAVAVRGSEEKIEIPVLSGAFRQLSKEGSVSRSGYFFRIFLSTNTGYGVGEGDTDVAVDPDAGETLWCCYAWPVNYANSGIRSFFINETGDIFATEDSTYHGTNGPKPGAALAEGGLDKIAGRPAVNAVAQDGNFWHQVN